MFETQRRSVAGYGQRSRFRSALARDKAVRERDCRTRSYSGISQIAVKPPSITNSEPVT